MALTQGQLHSVSYQCCLILSGLTYDLWHGRNKVRLECIHTVSRLHIHCSGGLGSKLSPGFGGSAGPQPLATSCSSHPCCGFHTTILRRSSNLTAFTHMYSLGQDSSVSHLLLTLTSFTLLTSPSRLLPSGNNSSTWGQHGSSAFRLIAHAALNQTAYV